MKRKIPLLLFLVLLIPLIAGSVALVKIRLENIVTVDYQKTAYPENNVHLNNLGRGFHQIFGYVLKDDGVYASLDDVPNLPKPEKEDESEWEKERRNDRLVQLQINLRNYADRPISDAALQQFDMILQAWSRTEYDIILRILYDWDGNALENEPKQISQIEEHMRQTAQVYNRYANRIFVIQGLSTGNTGEMHHTNYGSAEDLARLGKTLAEVSDPSIYLCVRTPNQWRSVTGADSCDALAAAANGKLFSGRLGLFNDGMLGNESDSGTYTDRSREEELAFQNALCRTVPNGGEVIVDNPYNDLENAIADMRTMHISYLNREHDVAVIDKWKTSVYHGSDVFDGISGYEYIREHLGYRYVIRDFSVAPRTSSKRKEPAIFLTIENTGFSVNYRKMNFQLTMKNTETGEVFTLTPHYDESSLPGNEKSVLEIPFDVHAYPVGTYQLYWQTTDVLSGGIVLYGNDMMQSEYGYRIGSISVDRPYKHSENAANAAKIAN